MPSRGWSNLTSFVSGYPQGWRACQSQAITMPVCAEFLFAGATLHLHDRDGLLQTLDRVAPLRGRIFVRQGQAFRTHPTRGNWTVTSTAPSATS
ncbi:hypothetical protein SBA4_2900022 [Candidatus Sulfopaludibacter sp. SbA4]|nr:hypothetical protein SBA4_2900022 [Candidatus Sulfopaludibacter sp. SbA4]